MIFSLVLRYLTLPNIDTCFLYHCIKSTLWSFWLGYQKIFCLLQLYFWFYGSPYSS